MQNIVMIKLYKDEYQCDFHDILLDKTNDLLKDLYKYSETINKKIFFNIIENMDIANFSNIAEIEYTDNISPEEKEYYLDFISKFYKDWRLLPKFEAQEYTIPFTVVFKQNNNISYSIITK